MQILSERNKRQRLFFCCFWIFLKLVLFPKPVNTIIQFSKQYLINKQLQSIKREDFSQQITVVFPSFASFVLGWVNVNLVLEFLIRFQFYTLSA